MHGSRGGWLQYRWWTLWSLAVGLTIAAVVALPATAGAQASTPYDGDVPAGGGVALLIANRDIATSELSAAIGSAGCDARSIAITEGGAWRVFVPGAPTFVNERFPVQLTDGTVFALFCATPYQDQTAEDAVALLEGYFADLDAGRYAEAYAAWREGATGQTLAEFEEGYAHTTSVSAEIGEPGRIDPGAGQRYIEIPVVIHATLDSGVSQTFTGTYTLHHTADIPGATPEQLTWHISAASLTQTE